jgi:hypothetical protein
VTGAPVGEERKLRADSRGRRKSGPEGKRQYLRGDEDGDQEQTCNLVAVTQLSRIRCQELSTSPILAVTPPMVAALLAAESMEKIMLGTKSNAVSFTLFVNVRKYAQPSGHGSPYPQSVVSYGDP